MPMSPAESEQNGGPVISQLQPSRGRLRFTEHAVTREQLGRCTARVELEWQGNDRAVGVAHGDAGRQGELRASAEATLRAIEKFTDGALTFDLAGVKVMRGFDADIVMVSVTLEQGGASQRLLGCHLAENDVMRGAVIATLHATNRLVGTFLAAKGQ